MTKAKEILHKHTRSNGCKASLRINPFLEQAVLNAINEAINYTHCCKSDSEQLCDKNEYGQIKKLYIRVGNEWVEQKKQ